MGQDTTAEHAISTTRSLYHWMKNAANIEGRFTLVDPAAVAGLDEQFERIMAEATSGETDYALMRKVSEEMTDVIIDADSQTFDDEAVAMIVSRWKTITNEKGA